jgi:hypothetical protein
MDVRRHLFPNSFLLFDEKHGNGMLSWMLCKQGIKDNCSWISISKENEKSNSPTDRGDYFKIEFYYYY